MAVLLSSCLPTSALAQASEASTLESCAAIGASTDHLACYDKLAGRAAAPEAPAAQLALPVTSPPSTSLLAPTGATLPDSPEPKAQTSLRSKYWELEAADKRGIFNFVGYRPSYVLPIHVTSRINRSPQSPTQATVEQPAYRR